MLKSLPSILFFLSSKRNKSLFLRKFYNTTLYNFIMKKYTYTEKKDTRSGFGDGLTELGRTNPNVVALCADLVGSLKMDQFIKENPERFFQIGIAEANMIGIAAGLTIGGKIPFTGTFANFSTGRVYDQFANLLRILGKM